MKFDSRNSQFFVPLSPSAAIENAGRGSASRGAFTDEARIALAKAVKRQSPTVVMDGNIMLLKYYDDYVSAAADNGPGLPCGCFSYDDLRRRLAK